MNPFTFFLQCGVRVFPVTMTTDGKKVPNVPSGTSWKDWDDFERPRPARPYGVVLGSLIVIDADTPATLAWVQANAPQTPFRVQTGPYHDGSNGRGVHHYYRAPQGASVPAFIRRDGLAIEFRREGQYVVGPNSRHSTGCTYRTANGSAWRWDDIPVFPVDGFCFDDASLRPVAATGAPYEVPDTVTMGERTAELFRFVRSCKAKGLTMDGALFAVWHFNLTRCEPPKWTGTWPDQLPSAFRQWFGRAWRQANRAGFAEWPVTDEPTLSIIADDNDALPVVQEGA